jgi:hypothetical protein
METKRINAVLACAILVFACSGISAQVVVQTHNGKLQGTEHNGVASFKGVPFAQPPIGDLRFKAPLPPKSWSGIRKADAFSAGCIQHKDISRGPWVEQYLVQGPTSEDCLYLNVGPGRFQRSGLVGLRLVLWRRLHRRGWINRCLRRRESRAAGIDCRNHELQARGSRLFSASSAEC